MASMATLFLTILAVAVGSAIADSDMLQDVCVADLSSGNRVNGYPCKDASQVAAEDFFFRGLANAVSATNATMGSVVTAANVEKIPGLNTMGVSLSRIDYAPRGLNPPHTHPRATEVVFVLEGQLQVGFITTSGKLISKSIAKGDVFVFPKGLVHFQKNTANTTASVISAFNSQLPGTQSIAQTLFGANPAVTDDILSMAFQIVPKQVKKIKSRFPPKK